jgi:hypothetical protein
MDPELQELPLTPTDRPLTDQAAAFIAAGRARFKTVDCFNFVPSDYELLWRTLDAMPRGRFCEWGSGWGIACGLAAMLGFDSHGVELDAPLAEASRLLLAEFELPVTIEAGSYFDKPYPADLYFTYCWPSLMQQTERWFAETAPPGARLLICHGQSDFRLKTRPDETDGIPAA